MKGTALQAAYIYQQYALEQNAIITMTDVKGTITYVNDKFCEISGYQEDELVGQNHRLLNSGNQPSSYWKDMFKTVLTGNVWKDEVRNKAKDGHYYWVDTTIVPLLNSYGKPEQYVSIRTDITEQKALANTLTNQTFAMEQHSIVAMTDVKGTITYVNDKFCEISGYEEDELIGQNHRILNSGNQSRSYWKDMFKVLIEGKCWHDDIRNIAKEGHYYWVETTIVPFLNLNGKPEKYVSIRTDITKQKELSDKLAEQKFAMDQHAIIATTDVKGDITYVNQKFIELSGYSQQELVGQNHRIINSANQPKSYWKDMYRTLATGEVWKDAVKNRAKDGSYYWVDTSVVPFMNLQGKPDSYISIRTDITHQKKVEEILSLQRFAMEQHSIIAITDITGTITYVNDKFCEISGYSQEELIGHNHRILNSGNQPKLYWTSMFRTVIDRGIWQDEVKNRAKDGSYYWVDTTIVPFINSKGKPDSYISIRTDITKYKQVQEKLELYQGELEQLVQDRTEELEKVNSELKVLSEIDPLTKIYNSRRLIADFTEHTEKNISANRKLALFYLDLDDFKSINDELGHEVGDALLQFISKKMVNLLAENETLYRVGGDEFCILVRNFDQVNALKTIAEKFISEISGIDNFGSMRIKIGCSIGIAIYPENGLTLSELTSSADRAMYQVKSISKGSFAFVDD